MVRLPVTNKLTISPTDRLTVAGQAANRSAARHVFDDYRSRKADNTLRRQDADLNLFRQYLADVGSPTGELHTDPDAWRGITWGLVAGFVRWQLSQGYAVRSINVRLSTVKVYAKLAFQAGAVDVGEHALIRTVNGYANKEAKHIDEKRESEGLATRYQCPGAKKREAVRIDQEQAAMLKTGMADTPQGRRDALLMCLLLDHGLRCGEVVLLTVGNFDVKAGTMTFYRPKVDKVQTHNLSKDTRDRLKAWLMSDAPLAADAPILRGSRKGGALTHAGMTARAITGRVKELGARVGVTGLSAHDCRHYWATFWAGKVDTFRLQEAGGWNSLAMPRRYVEHAKIANEGME
jgi:integrase